MDVRSITDGVQPQSLQNPINTQADAASSSDSSASFVNTLVNQMVLMSALEGNGNSSNPEMLSELTQMLGQQGASSNSKSSSSGLTIPTAEFLIMNMMQNLQVPGMDSSNSDSTDSMDGLGGMGGSSLGMSGLQSIMTALSNPTFTSPLTTASGASSAYLASIPGALGNGTVDVNNLSLSNWQPLDVSNQGNISQVINQAVVAASDKYGVPANLIRGVIQQESGGNPSAQSSAGAQGLMQLMPSTAQGLGVTNPFDPVQNIDGGTRYLAGLLQEFHGDESLALAAYNAGPAAVTSYGGVPPYAETQNYVKSVLAYAGQYA